MSTGNRTAYLFTNYTGTPAKKPESASTIASEVAEALRIIAREKTRKYRAANRKRAAGAKA
jgi:hypothetical protein